MAKFSERIGEKQPKTEIQINTMDKDLKTSLWNVINIYINTPLQEKCGNSSLKGSSMYYALIHDIWYSFFKRETDSLLYLNGYSVVAELKSMYDKMSWFEVYDFVDFLANCNRFFTKIGFIKECNVVLKRELSGYRFIENQLTPISNEAEIAQIEEALTITSNTGINGVNIHLKAALNKMSDRKAPDYRNSIKESISAVEGICRIICGDDKVELSKALSKIKKILPIHSALIEGFIKIYGYTSDGDGIRHALHEETNVDQEDALFMVVACSAFINYLIVKMNKAGIIIAPSLA